MLVIPDPCVKTLMIIEYQYPGVKYSHDLARAGFFFKQGM